MADGAVFWTSRGAIGNARDVNLRPTASILVCATLLLGPLAPGRAVARRQHEVHYPFQRVWNTALRMVRVDMGLPITDRDPDAGYMLFEYIDADRKYPGSIEVITGEKDKRPVMTLVINVRGMPSYVEQMLLDKLEKKLLAEYGAPLDPPKDEPAPPEPAPEKRPSETDEGQVEPRPEV